MSTDRKTDIPLNPPSAGVRRDRDDSAESLSRAVSLSVLEIDADAQHLVPAFLLADLMSPVVWAWRDQKREIGRAHV